MAPLLAALSPIDIFTLYLVIPAIVGGALWLGTELLRISRLLRALPQKYMVEKDTHPLTPEQGAYVLKIILRGATWAKIAFAAVCLGVVIDQLRFGILRWASQEFGTATYATQFPLAGLLVDDFSSLVVKGALLATFVGAIFLIRAWRIDLDKCYSGTFPANMRGVTNAPSV